MASKVEKAAIVANFREAGNGLPSCCLTLVSYFCFTVQCSQNIANNLSTGEWEHVVVSNIKSFIPESFKKTWHDWRVSMKKTERGIEGSNEISEHVEMAGWGIEEADKAHKSNASRSYHIVSYES